MLVLIISKNYRQPVTAAPHYNHFGIARSGKFQCGIYPFLPQYPVRKALVEDLVVYCNTFGFDPFSLGFTSFPVKTELIRKCFLFLLEF